MSEATSSKLTSTAKQGKYKEKEGYSQGSVLYTITIAPGWQSQTLAQVCARAVRSLYGSDSHFAC